MTGYISDIPTKTSSGQAADVDVINMTNQHFIDKIALQLHEITKGTHPIGNAQMLNFQMHDGVAYSLSNDAAIKFNELISLLLKHNNFSKIFSAKYVEKNLKSIFAKLLADNTIDLENEIDHLIKEFSKYNKNNVIFLQIEGIKISVCMQLGKVRLVPGDEFLINNINEKVAEISKTSKNTEESKIYIQQLIEQNSRTELEGSCVGVVEVNAEPIRAFEVAKEEVRRVIDLLRYASKALYPLQEDIRIGLKGDHPKSKRQGFIISDSGFNTQGDNIGSVISFEIDGLNIKKLEGVGVFRISDALKKKQANNIEEALIRSIHWFSVALTQNENSNAFLFLIVALESLFKAQPGSSIGGTVAESSAFLMSDTLKGRKKIIAIMRKYYGKRSGVAHGGNKSVTDSELYTLVNIVGTIIMVTIDKLDDFFSQDDLMAWIEELKLT